MVQVAGGSLLVNSKKKQQNGGQCDATEHIHDGMLLEKDRGCTDGKRQQQGSCSDQGRVLEASIAADCPVDSHSAGHMNGRADIGRRIHRANETCQLAEQVISCDVLPQVDGVGPEAVNRQADGHACKHDEAELQEQLLIFEHKVGQSTQKI